MSLGSFDMKSEIDLNLQFQHSKNHSSHNLMNHMFENRKSNDFDS